MLEELFKSLLGDSGAKALTALLETPLKHFVTPRVIVSWLRHAPEGALEIPQGCPLVALNKSINTYNGQAVVDGVHYEFQGFNEAQVAATIVTSLGVETGALKVKDINLAKLSKTIDLLVKSHLVTPTPAVEAQPAVEPQEVVGPTPTQSSSGVKAVRKIPSLKNKLKLTKAESLRKCGVCKGVLFKSDKFVGCTCYGAMSKSVTTNLLNDGFVLEFGPEWYREAFLALAGLFKYGG